MILTLMLAAAAATRQPPTIAAALMRLNDAPPASFAALAAPDAWLLHEGIQPVATLLAKGEAQAPPRAWWPARTVTSCDGSLALATGTLRDAAAAPRGFLTIWERQSDRQWRWVFDGRTDEAPEGTPAAVTAACGRVPAASPDPSWQASGESADGTLRWRMAHGDGEDRHHFRIEYLTKTGWQLFAEATVS